MREKQQKILNIALENVPFDGWTDSTLQNATKNAGFDEKYVKIAFKGGVFDAVELFLQNIDAKTYASINMDELGSMKIRIRIFHILDSRFRIMGECKATIRKTVQFLAMPQNIYRATKLLWKMADNAWYAAGDTAVDFNHYTKRATLAAVYSSTLLFWLDDDSENHSATSEFLMRRIENVMKFEKFKAGLKFSKQM